MAAGSERTFGFELINKLYDNQVTKKEDVIVLFVHWYIVRCGFRCIGLGNSKAYDPTQRGSELLPEEWNTRPNYSLRYLREGKLYILHGIRSDEDILLNLMKADDNNVTNVQFPIEQTVKELHGPLETMIPSYESVMDTLQRELLRSMVPRNTKESSAQTREEESSLEDESNNEDSQLRRPSRRLAGPQYPDPDDLWEVGRADLDPFRGGGGMLLNPRDLGGGNRHLRPGLGVPGELPRGAVPPGARFDPFGPPEINQPRPHRRRDDPDFDYMFM